VVEYSKVGLAVFAIIFGIAGVIYAFFSVVELFLKREVYIENDPEIAINMIKNEVGKAKNFILIVSSHANATVYNNSVVMQAFRKASKRIGPSNIKIVAGPEIYTIDGKNGLVELAKEGVINLAVPSEQQNKHFRCIDFDVYDEDPHPSAEHHRKAKIYKHDLNKVVKFKQSFEEIYNRSSKVNDTGCFMLSPQP
jgi:hypothetical protein